MKTLIGLTLIFVAHILRIGWWLFLCALSLGAVGMTHYFLGWMGVVACVVVVAVVLELVRE